MAASGGAMVRVAREFREFALRGNAVDLAVGVVFGVAFGALIDSLVKDVLLQIIAGIFGQPSFTDIAIPFGKSTIRVGAFLDAVMNFLFVALALFFIVKVANAVARARGATAADAATGEEILLLREIRDELRSNR